MKPALRREIEKRRYQHAFAVREGRLRALLQRVALALLVLRNLLNTARLSAGANVATELIADIQEAVKTVSQPKR